MHGNDFEQLVTLKAFYARSCHFFFFNMNMEKLLSNAHANKREGGIKLKLDHIVL